jgi:hypothetical protein
MMLAQWALPVNPFIGQGSTFLAATILPGRVLQMNVLFGLLAAISI